jgi:hypothetical protein
MASSTNNYNDNNDNNDHQEITDEWLLQFFADREKVQNDPTYRAELTTMKQHLAREDGRGTAAAAAAVSDPRYPTTPEEVDTWISEHKDAAAGSAETTQEQIYSYPDGTVYMGHMRQITPEEEEHETRGHYQRHGPGTLRTPAFVYGMSQKSYTSDEAAENAGFAKWFEYVGTWKNDKLHGYGVHVQKSGDGSEILIFEGIWENGKPMRSIHAKDEDGVYDFDESVFGW